MWSAIEGRAWLACAWLGLLAGGCGEPSTELAALSDRQLNLSFRSDADPANDVVWIEVTSSDPRSGCLQLDPDTEFELAGRKLELGDPTGDGEDDCPREAVAFDLEEVQLDRSSPTQVRVADASMTMAMSVRDLFVARRLSAPTRISGCSDFTLTYGAPFDALRASDVDAEFEPSEAGLPRVPTLSVASVEGSTIRVGVNYVAPGDAAGPGILRVTIGAEPPIESCTGASRCVAQAVTRFEANVVLSAGCN